MKKVLNDPKNVVDEMIKGFVSAFPKKVKRIEGTDVVVRTEKKEGKVALVSGGGSGHEPSHAGFLGEGMLDGAVCGAVFTSPTPDQVFEGIKAVSTEQGVLLIIKNYTGDIMNFEMAMEMAEGEGVKVDKVVIDDDVAVENSTWTQGRRGIAGTVLLHKIAGAKAESGASLEEVKTVAEKVVANVKSMGMALTACIVPEAGKPSFTLEENEMEIGLGIHGEPGVRKEPLKPADVIVDELMEKILENLSLSSGDEVVVLVNGLGGTPLMELFVANKRVNEILSEKGVKIFDTMVGEYMTAIEMAGFSISVLKLDDELKALYSAKADTPALKCFGGCC